ncbi:MAG TPA: hypothetical protein EYH05_12470 [Anaerolineae bacterium]|nr:hypothetical protein [Anaerolineae bacterium]
MEQVWWRVRDRLDEANVAGIITAVLGLIISFAGRGIIPGRELGDPIVLTLSASQLIQGRFFYFNWRGLAFHLLFVVFLGGLAVVVLWLLSGRQPVGPAAAVRAGRLAAIVNVTAVALTEVDAFIVGFWYVAAGLISAYITGFVAGQITRRWK